LYTSALYLFPSTATQSTAITHPGTRPEVLLLTGSQ
jgi:hypothetical protein